MNEWISVKDRLPNAGDHALIYARSAFEDNFWICHAEYVQGEKDNGEPTKKFFWLSVHDNEYFSFSKINYWRPLPEPPEENE